MLRSARRGSLGRRRLIGVVRLPSLNEHETKVAENLSLETTIGESLCHRK